MNLNLVAAKFAVVKRKYGQSKTVLLAIVALICQLEVIGPGLQIVTGEAERKLRAKKVARCQTHKL